MFEPARTRTPSICSGLTSCDVTSFIMASIVGWPSEPHGYGLNETPGSTIENGLPSGGTTRGTPAPPPETRKKPHSPSGPPPPAGQPRAPAAPGAEPVPAPPPGRGSLGRGP